MEEDANLRNGLNVCRGQITHEAVAKALELPYSPKFLPRAA
jgi:alanine dehydrogenase